jgi:ssDNA-binding Zn-finger/Zn-ribbon topoisomerase 1
MVEFCTNCGTSLPKGDLTIKGGELFTSHDYTCPTCRNTANPEKKGKKAPEPEAGPDADLMIKDGAVNKE